MFITYKSFPRIERGDFSTSFNENSLIMILRIYREVPTNIFLTVKMMKVLPLNTKMTIIITSFKLFLKVLAREIEQGREKGIST